MLAILKKIKFLYLLSMLLSAILCKEAICMFLSEDASYKIQRGTVQKYGRFGLRDEVAFTLENFVISHFNMINFAMEVRIGGLYEDAAKFIGRIEIADPKTGGFAYTGTGTLINWDGVPQSYQGRLVLTCLHNCPNGIEVVFPAMEALDFSTIFSNVESSCKDSVLRTQICLAGDRCDKVSLEKYMYFTPDLDKMNLTPREAGILETSIPVVACYAMKNGANFKDIAILILKNKIEVDSRACASIVDFSDKLEGQKCFAIGYGRPSCLSDNLHSWVKILYGWNLKKKTKDLEIRKEEAKEEAMDYIIQDSQWVLGPSDSGGPVVNYDCKILGIACGNIAYSLKDEKQFFEAVADDIRNAN